MKEHKIAMGAVRRGDTRGGAPGCRRHGSQVPRGGDSRQLPNAINGQIWLRRLG